MAKNLSGALTDEEKRIVRALLDKGQRNQDIQALINIGRSATINGARISEVKKIKDQESASEEEIEFFYKRKQSYDLRTGLNLYDDERLIRAREAMTLAVHVFNSAAIVFKTEVFSVLANIAWTYVLHEYYEREGIAIVDANDRSLLLSQMIERNDCPLSSGMRDNLRSLIGIRNEVEHNLFRKGDLIWLGLFQACCLNFDKILRDFFGEKLTLASELPFALQFMRPNMEQIGILSKYEIPPHIESFDARLSETLTPEQQNDTEYKFRVIFTLDAASKSRTHFEFINPNSDDGRQIQNILVNYKPGDHLYPYKPKAVFELVTKVTGMKFSSHNHVQAWRLFGVRPHTKSKQPENTNKQYCIFHPAHKDYTYSQAWVDFLVEQVSDPEKFDKIRSKGR